MVFGRRQPTDAVVRARLMFSRAAVCDWRGREQEREELEGVLALGLDCRTSFKGDCVEPLLAHQPPLGELRDLPLAGLGVEPGIIDRGADIAGRDGVDSHLWQRAG